MHPELETLLKALDAYLQAKAGEEADQRLARYEALLEEMCDRTRIQREILERAVRRAYQRWQWAEDPIFPKALRKTRLE